MAENDFNFRQQIARLQVSHIKSYLLGRGWEQKPSRYVDHLLFESEVCDDGKRLELYLPASTSVPKYQTTLMRAIYKLCGVEDREPGEIACDMLASEMVADVPPRSDSVKRLRIYNSGTTPLQVRIESPLREHELLSGEAIELNCDMAADGALVIEHSKNCLTILSMRGK